MGNILFISIVLTVIILGLCGRVLFRLLRKFNTEKREGPFRIAQGLFIYVFPGIGLLFINGECGERPFDFHNIPTACTLWVVFAVAHVLSYYYKKKLSPLLLIFSATGMMAGVIYCAVICVHFSAHVFMILFPVLQLLYIAPLFCCIYLLKELNQLNRFLSISLATLNAPTSFTSLNSFYKWLKKYNLWFALYLLAPFTAVIQASLYLFGQQPDSVIRLFTESCGFLLSHQQHCSCGGDHYLCSIAANGNKRFVKPIRLGWRQNEKILVNRQLLIANAFENWLEDYAPGFHKQIRKAYDNCNIPVNTWSKRKKLANILYVFMKPLEWLFLGWLYLMDTHPENRIASQYLPKQQLDSYIKKNK